MATRRKLNRKTLEVAPSRAQDGSRSPRGDLLKFVVRSPEKRRRFAGVVVGTLKSVRGEGKLMIDFPANPAQAEIEARSIVAVRSSDVGRPVALMFEESDPRRPIVIGLVQPSPGRQSAIGTEHQAPPHVEIDGERLVLTAQKEIVLRCGKATIILTRAGKVLIRGAYVLNRSSGVNRIKGGSVQIN
jgi:hypothetical protein